MARPDLPEDHPLHGVQAFTFDVFGTVTNWHGTVVRELAKKAAETPDPSGLLKGISNDEWSEFAVDWRRGYQRTTRSVAGGGEGPLNVDIMHRQLLDGILSTEHWANVGRIWGEKDRQELNLIWHRLDGWPDSSNGLYALKKYYVISTLSNGNVRLLIDLAKYADLPWDTVLSAELLGSFKPNPLVYQWASHHLSPTPNPTNHTHIAMVAAHLSDLRAARAACPGLRTVYIRRPTEDSTVRETVRVRPITQGGSDAEVLREYGETEVDVVVDGIEELAALVGSSGSNV